MHKIHAYEIVITSVNPLPFCIENCAVQDSLLAACRIDLTILSIRSIQHASPSMPT